MTKWKHPSSVPRLKFKAMQALRNVANVLWEHNSVLLVDVLDGGDAVTAEHYCGTHEM